MYVGSHKGPLPNALPLLEKNAAVAFDTHLESLQTTSDTVCTSTHLQAQLSQHII